MENIESPNVPIKDAEPKESFWDMVKFGIVVLAVVVPIRMFIAHPFIVSGASMYPTFHDTDYLIVDEISYHLGDPHRGDVVIFRYPRDPSKFFIKRIIGLPGEIIQIKNGAVTIINDAHPDGFTLDEPYITNKATDSLSYTVGKSEYFVMGDNRIASSDSRYWGGVPRENMTGRAFLRLFPFTQVSVFPGAEKEFIQEQ